MNKFLITLTRWLLTNNLFFILAPLLKCEPFLVRGKICPLIIIRGGHLLWEEMHHWEPLRWAGPPLIKSAFVAFSPLSEPRAIMAKFDSCVRRYYKKLSATVNHIVAALLFEVWSTLFYRIVRPSGQFPLQPGNRPLSSHITEPNQFIFCLMP